MALAVERRTEKLVSDRQGATKSKVSDRVLVCAPPGMANIRPRDGLTVGTFDSKKSAMKSINATKSTKLNTGAYLIKSGDWTGVKTYKVDRDTYREFIHSKLIKNMKHKY